MKEKKRCFFWLFPHYWTKSTLSFLSVHFVTLFLFHWNIFGWININHSPIYSSDYFELNIYPINKSIYAPLHLSPTYILIYTPAISNLYVIYMPYLSTIYISIYHLSIPYLYFNIYTIYISTYASKVPHLYVNICPFYPSSICQYMPNLLLVHGSE